MKKKLVARPTCEQCRVTDKKLGQLSRDIAAAHQNMDRWQVILEERNDAIGRCQMRIAETEHREARLRDLVRVFVRQLLPHLTPVQFWQTVHDSAISCGFAPEAFILEIQQALEHVVAGGYVDALRIARTIERANEFKS